MVELKTAKIQLRNVIKYRFLYVHWSIESPTADSSGCSGMGTPLPLVKSLTQSGPMVKYNGHRTSQHCFPTWIFSGKLALGLKAWFVWTAQHPWTHYKNQGSICYTIYSKRQRKQGHCAKHQLDLLVSHRSKTPRNKIAFAMQWIMEDVYQVSGKKKKSRNGRFMPCFVLKQLSVIILK